MGLFSLKWQPWECFSRPGTDSLKPGVGSHLKRCCVVQHLRLHSPGRKASSCVFRPLLGRNHVQALGHTGWYWLSGDDQPLDTHKDQVFILVLANLLAMSPGARGFNFPSVFHSCGVERMIISARIELAEGRWDKVCNVLSTVILVMVSISKITGYIILILNAPETTKKASKI